MEILGHYIVDDAIIGISNLFKLTHPDQAMNMLYDAYKLTFKVHTKSQSITIDSDYILPKPENAKATKMHSYFLGEYIKAYKQIFEMYNTQKVDNDGKFYYDYPNYVRTLEKSLKEKEAEGANTASTNSNQQEQGLVNGPETNG